MPEATCPAGLAELRPALAVISAYIDAAHDHEADFLRTFANCHATDLVELSFSAEQVRLVYILSEGQHISDSIPVAEFLAWLATQPAAGPAPPDPEPGPEVFAAELALLADPALQAFCAAVLARIDPRFYDLSSSSSGLHHPAQQQGPGGLVRHTRVVVYLARRLAKAFALDAQQTDLALAAALLHDIGKPYELKNGGTSSDCHDLLGRDLVEAAGIELGYPAAPLLADLVAGHMGRWGTPGATRLGGGPLHQVVQLADYTASQKGLNFAAIDSLNAGPPGQLP